MNKKAQIAETIGAVALIVGSILGVVKIGADISTKDNYIADLSFLDNTSQPCVYEESCNNIDNILCGETKVYDSLEKANSDGFRLCPCP
jgi:hypothetical protein